MEQKENHNQPSGELFAPLRRLRAQGKRLSVSETPSSSKEFMWNEAISNRIPEANDKSFPVEKKLFTRRRLPLIIIEEDRNVYPESSERVGAWDTLSAKKQHPSESGLRIRRTLQRRSCVPSLMNTESLSPVNANGFVSKDKVKKTNMGISPAAYSSGESQGGNNVPEKHESFKQSLGIMFESRLAGRRRSRLHQEEGSDTKASDGGNERCHGSSTKKEDERIVENEKKTNLGPSRFTQLEIEVFESADINDGGKELASPLLMMAQTPIISRTSVLQNPVDQKQLKASCGPTIKKSLLNHNMQTSRFRRRWSSRLQPQPEDASWESHQNEEFKTAVPSNINKCENSLEEGLVGCRKEPRDRDPKDVVGSIPDIISKPVRESNTGNQTSTCSARKEKFPQHSRSSRRALRRRSAGVLGLRTPLRKKSANFEANSTCKSNICPTSSKRPQLSGSKNDSKPRKSLIFTNNSSSYPQKTVLLPDNEAQEKDNLAQSQISEDVLLKADSFNCSSLDSVSAGHEDMKIVEDIESLLKEQEEIIIKACLLQKRIEARRRDMKAKKLMESFMTSVSPLKRLKAMISHKMGDDGNKLEENLQPCKIGGDNTVCEVDVEGPHVVKKSEMEWSSPKTVPVISDPQSHWRRQQNKRLVRTSQDSSPENEEFLDPCQGSSSPFTTLVGDCERPSIAPMTPHSRHNISEIRKSLRKQLEQLYDK